MKWNVRLGDAAQKQLLSIKDTRIREQIRTKIRGLAENPDIQGKSLGDDLVGYRSVKVVKARYRILYKIETDEIIVLVVTVGIRKEGDKKDAYAMAKKLLQLNLLDLFTPLLSLSTPENEDELAADEEPEANDEYQYPEPEE